MSLLAVSMKPGHVTSIQVHRDLGSCALTADVKWNVSSGHHRSLNLEFECTRASFEGPLLVWTL